MQHALSSRIQVRTLGRGNKEQFGSISKIRLQPRTSTQSTPLGPGKEFKPPDVLRLVFGLHPQWQRMEDFLTHGSKWPLVEISKEEQINDLNNALTFGNHKGALAKPQSWNPC
jgi:hypothetical protein